MYVLTALLHPADLNQLSVACERNRLELVLARPDHIIPLRDDLIAFFDRRDAPSLVAKEEIFSRGVHTILVKSELSARSTLAARHAGYSFMLASPLRIDRLTSLLGYLRTVAVPPMAQILHLDGTDTLSTPSSSTRLDAAEAAALRILGARPDQIVSREDLASAMAGADPLTVTSRLQLKFDEIGSGAQLMKVPHMGIRLAGRILVTPAGGAHRSVCFIRNDEDLDFI